ncbi:hypothetical protein [Polaribacter sp.]|uniref:hypothetical protein n=1 Tax=Polaribacter sp. TaxID=1920175 RepID=UPI003F6A720D
MKHSNDRFLDENELQLFKLELNKFLGIISKSKFDKPIKDKLNKLNFDLTLPKFKGFNLIAYLLNDHWNNDRNIGELMSKKLVIISEEIEHLILELKNNY